MRVIRGWLHRRSGRRAAVTVATLHRRGQLLLDRGRVGDAEQVLAEAVRVAGAAHGPDAGPTLAARMARVAALSRGQRLAEAEAEVRDVLRRCPDSAEVPERWTADVQLALARVLRSRARYAEAEAEARGVLQRGVESVAPPASATENEARILLAEVIGAQGRHSEAVRSYDSLIESLEPGCPVGLRARLGRAVHVNYLGRHAEAAAEDRALGEAAIATAWSGAAQLRLSAQHNLVLALGDLGLRQEAEELARAGMASAVRRGPNFGRYVFLFQVALAHLLNARGEHAEALRGAEQALAARPEGARLIDDAERAGAVRAAALLGLGRAAEAVDLARAILDRHRAWFGPAHHRTLTAEALLGRCLTGAGDDDEARELLLANAAAWREHFGPDLVPAPPGA